MRMKRMHRKECIAKNASNEKNASNALMHSSARMMHSGERPMSDFELFGLWSGDFRTIFKDT